MLKVSNLEINFGGIKAVNVKKGSIVSLIGANGAGKTTTLRGIMGVVKVHSGNILFEDKNITNLETPEIVENGITLCPEGRRIFPDMTTLDNLKIGAYLRKDNIDNDIKKMYQMFPRLKERSWQLAGTLSGGEQQMLAVARSLMSRPKLMMLDEPSLGLAPLVVKNIFNMIKEINEQGVTILLIEQNANMALKISDYSYVLETGNIVMEGPGNDLLHDERIKSAYLGK